MGKILFGAWAFDLLYGPNANVAFQPRKTSSKETKCSLFSASNSNSTPLTN
jgi:hypothetical protein